MGGAAWQYHSVGGWYMPVVAHYQAYPAIQIKTGYALFLNGNLQFNSFDEYRYHEALVHPT